MDSRPLSSALTRYCLPVLDGGHAADPPLYDPHASKAINRLFLAETGPVIDPVVRPASGDGLATGTAKQEVRL